MALEEVGKSEIGTLRLVSHNPKAGEPQPVESQFVNFAFYRALPTWRTLDAATKDAAKSEFLAVCEESVEDVLITSYSLVGLGKNADLMLWRVGRELDLFQTMTERINQTMLGRHLKLTENFLSMTKRSMFIDAFDAEHIEDRLHIVPGKCKFLFVFPFAKTQEWYLRSAEDRQQMTDEYIRIGLKYRSVKQHTTFSFGLDDCELVNAFETDEPQDFLELVEELRFAAASKYTLRDTPVFACRQRDLAECLNALG